MAFTHRSEQATRSVLFVLLVACCLAPAIANADRQEWQLSPVGVVGASSVRNAGRSVWSLAGGAAVRAAGRAPPDRFRDRAFELAIGVALPCCHRGGWSLLSLQPVTAPWPVRC